MSKQKGKIIRIGKELEAILTKKRKKRESFDALLRRCLGLPDKRGNKQLTPLLLHCFWVVANEGNPLAFSNEADARGAAIRLAIRNGKKKTERVIRALEVTS